ncbi:MAG: NAD-dependent succinate-semialdehyde dehydrogenase [bacterium]|jgi:succinate-semialdehyde dehydrogenase/glutarate-semialdehyde dehydrogenase|nr:NAD-dependent succinate-semialdehyde dehydrogenase [bacterium]
MPTAEQVLSALHREMLIGGDWVPAAAGGELPVEDPATQETIAVVPDGDTSDADRAVNAAASAQAAWAATAPRARGEILERAFRLMTSRADDLALLMTLENGKTIAESKGEIAYAADFFRWFAEQSVRIDGRYTVSPNGQTRLLVTKQPVGVCLMATPWNFPAAMITRKVGPAIAAGCTMVVKPARETPLSALAVAQILLEAGLPPGVLNVITTSHPSQIVNHVMADPRVRKVSFTGSTEVGKSILRGAADHVLRSSMELGGNAPFLVFDDADVEAAVEGAMVAKMRNIGEACTSANRFYVADRLAGDFTDLLAQRMGSLRLGHGAEEGVQVGPLINEQGRSKVAELVGDMVSRGGTVAVGGHQVDGRGYFFEPTVVTDVAADSRALQEEIFGPVAPIVTFSDEDAALRFANATQYGLVAYVYTRDVGRAFRIAEGLEYGMVGLNAGLVSNASAPFGGVKESGIGREGGHEGIEGDPGTEYIALNW